MRNQHGLPRHIPSDVAREVRQRSKFGCVICRAGFYEYEHIEPAFADARKHDPSKICCLCASCHGSVTRGQRSKASVAAAYAAIQAQTNEEAGAPVGPIDFHGGNAQLLIGGLRYSPLVKTAFRYHDIDIIRVRPGDENSPGGISAIFTNDAGIPVLQLDDNVWVGSTDNWDIEVRGPRIKVTSDAGRVALRLRLEPPGTIVIEQLDMRLDTAHLLVSEETYAAGRYLANGSIAWVSVGVQITRTSEDGAAIEYSTPEELVHRDLLAQDRGQRLSAGNAGIVLSSGAGAMWIPVGIAVASRCGGFNLFGAAMGVRPLDGMRRAVARGNNNLMRYIGTGEE